MEAFSKLSDSEKIKFFDAFIGLINTDGNGGGSSKPNSPEKLNLNTILGNVKGGQKDPSDDASSVSIIDPGKKQKTLDSWLIKGKNASPSKELQTDTILYSAAIQTNETIEDTLSCSFNKHDKAKDDAVTKLSSDVNIVLERCQDSDLITESNSNVTDSRSLLTSKPQKSHVSNSLNQSSEGSSKSKFSKSANLNDAPRLVSNVNSDLKNCVDSNQVTANNEIAVDFSYPQTSTFFENKLESNKQSPHKPIKAKNAQIYSDDAESVPGTEKYNFRKNRKRKHIVNESVDDECNSTMKYKNNQDNSPKSSSSESFNYGMQFKPSVTSQNDLLSENMEIDTYLNDSDNTKKWDNKHGNSNTSKSYNLRAKKKDVKLNSSSESSVERLNNVITTNVTNENALLKVTDQETGVLLSNFDCKDVACKAKQISSSNVESVNVTDKYNLRPKKKRKKKYCELTFLHECKSLVKLDKNDDINSVDSCDEDFIFNNKELTQSKMNGCSGQDVLLPESMEVDTNSNNHDSSKESDCQSTDNSNTNKSTKQRAKKQDLTLNNSNVSDKFSNCILPHIDSTNKDMLQRINNRNTTVSSSYSDYEALCMLNAKCSEIGLSILDILKHEKIEKVLNDNEKIDNEAVVLLGSFKSGSDKILPVVHLIESKEKLFEILIKLQKKF